MQEPIAYIALVVAVYAMLQARSNQKRINQIERDMAEKSQERII